MEELLGRIDVLLEHSQRLIDILHMIANHARPTLPLHGSWSDIRHLRNQFS
jgi:hypothetical protein